MKNGTFYYGHSVVNCVCKNRPKEGCINLKIMKYN